MLPASSGAGAPDSKLVVCVLEPHALIRAGLEHLLSSHGLTSTDTLGSATVVLADLSAPVAFDLLATTDLPVVAFAHPMTPWLALRALELGARRVLDDDEGFENALAALVSTPSERMSPGLASRVAEAALVKGSMQPLTAREVEVLEALAKTGSLTQVARLLGIAPLTARNHVTRILTKLRVSSRPAMLERARQLGLIRPPSDQANPTP